jgi:hypothetical protein
MLESWTQLKKGHGGGESWPHDNNGWRGRHRKERTPTRFNSSVALDRRMRTAGYPLTQRKRFFKRVAAVELLAFLFRQPF